MRTPSVLVIGESLIDVVRTGDAEQRHVGGSPLNVAFGLGRLDIPVFFATRLGADEDGARIQKHLASAGVVAEGNVVDEVPTSTAIADIQSDGSANYTFDIQWRLSSLSPLTPSRWTHVGSLGASLLPGADTVETYLHTVHGRSEISYDPNIRAALAPAHDVALARFERICRLASVVKLSDEDARWLYPGLTMTGVMDTVQGLGPNLVAITLGAEGSVLSTRAATVTVRPIHINLADTIGAGDSYMAALIAGLLREGPPADEAHLHRLGHTAAVVAAITCSRSGAFPPTSEELRDFLPL